MSRRNNGANGIARATQPPTLLAMALRNDDRRTNRRKANSATRAFSAIYLCHKSDFVPEVRTATKSQPRAHRVSFTSASSTTIACSVSLIAEPRVRAHSHVLEISGLVCRRNTITTRTNYTNAPSAIGQTAQIG